MNDVLGCFLDLERGEIRWSKNGTYLVINSFSCMKKY